MSKRLNLIKILLSYLRNETSSVVGQTDVSDIYERKAKHFIVPKF
jgi:hypothetical protein